MGGVQVALAQPVRQRSGRRVGGSGSCSASWARPCATCTVQFISNEAATLARVQDAYQRHVVPMEIAERQQAAAMAAASITPLPAANPRA